MVKSIKSLKTIQRVLRSKNRTQIRRIDNEQFRAILNVLSKILNRDIEVSPTILRKMYKHRNIFRHLADPRNQNIERKKQYVSNQRGGFFPILASILPFLF